jgi:ribosomal protein S18 acetylase RimI-like enzyme
MGIRFSELRDVIPVLNFLKATGFFREEELNIAEEVIAEASEKGMSGHYQSYVLDDGAGPTGWVCWGETPCTVGTYDVYWLGVAPECQGKGAGKLLMEFCEMSIRDGGGRLFIVETSGGDRYVPTRAFYQRIGYQEAARIKDFYAPDDDKVIYTKLVGSLKT